MGGSLLTSSGSDADWATLGAGSSDWGSSYDGMGAALGGGGGGDGFVSSLKSQDYADGLVNEVGAAQCRGCRGWLGLAGVPSCLAACRVLMPAVVVAGRAPPTAAAHCCPPLGPAPVQVGEGNSFRREQRERYGAPLLNMTNLAHATEEELLVGAEAQVGDWVNGGLRSAGTPARALPAAPAASCKLLGMAWHFGWHSPG